MKQRLPLKSIAAIMSVALLYTLMIALVDKCGDFYDNGLFIADATPEATDSVYAEDSDLTAPDDITNIYTQIDWWKAGIEEYGYMFDEVNVNDETSGTTSKAPETSVTTQTEGTTSGTTTGTTSNTTTPSQTTTTAPETTTTTTEETTTTTTPTTTTTTTTPPTTTTTHSTTQKIEETSTTTTRPADTTSGGVVIIIPGTEATTTTPAPSGNNTVIPPHDLTGETLTVYDLVTGQYVTDDALTILIQTTWNEVGNFHEEAIKAQAVAAYTYIKYCNTYGIKASVALKNGASQKSINAVKSVAGQAMYYNDKFIQATYCAATGGTTASSKSVWGNSYPYLVSVPSAFDAEGGAYYGKQKTYTVDQIRNMIESKTNITLSDDPENWFTVVSYIDGKYVNELLIDGNSSCVLSSNGRTRKITGALLRESIMGQSKLLSSQFEVSYSDGVFTFTTYGYGHGVGMSQYGAQYYATMGGWSYLDILNHYYTGVTIK